MWERMKRGGLNPWRVVGAWLALMGVETVHGILRRLYLVPKIGDLGAQQVGVAIGSGLVLGMAWATVRWMGRGTGGAWIRVGAAWTGLTVVFEVGLGRAVGMSWDRIGSDYDLGRGGFMLIGMGVLVMAPYLAARVRGVVVPAGPGP